MELNSESNISLDEFQQTSLKMQEEHEQSVIRRTIEWEQSGQMSVKLQIKQMEYIQKDCIDQLTKDLENSSFNIKQLQTGFHQINENTNLFFDEITRYCSKEFGRIQMNFRKEGKDEVGEMDFIALQAHNLKIDTYTLKQTFDQLEVRTQYMEKDVGFKFVYDDIENPNQNSSIKQQSLIQKQ